MLQLGTGTLDWTRAYVATYGDTNLMPIPFEYAAIDAQWPRVRHYLSNVDTLNWTVRAYRRTLAPKNRFGFRSVTQLDPYDFFVYTGLVFEAGPEIEASRLPLAQDVAFSHRFLPDVSGQFFDPASDWTRFQNKSRAHCATHSHVVIADIADFFPRIYSHPLDNALVEALAAKPSHANAIRRFLKQLNQNVSYGIPTGPEASFLLAELLLDLIDRGLLSEGVAHCRWADDFRIFCASEREAYSSLNLLARILFETYGLTLQQNKTRILTSEDFLHRIDPEADVEIMRLSEELDGLLRAVGIEPDSYAQISLDTLDNEQREHLDALNLVGILEEQIDSDVAFSQPIVRFVMWRLSQLGDPNAVELLIERLDSLYPVALDVLKYVNSVNIPDAARRQSVVNRLLNALDTTAAAESEHLRAWMLAILSKPGMLTDERQLVQLFNRYPDEYAQRQVITALGRAHAQSWIKPRKQLVSSLAPWLRRAYLAAASSLPGDEPENYYRSIKSRLDPLEQVVCDWALANPF